MAPYSCRMKGFFQIFLCFQHRKKFQSLGRPLRSKKISESWPIFEVEKNFRVLSSQVFLSFLVIEKIISDSWPIFESEKNFRVLAHLLGQVFLGFLVIEKNFRGLADLLGQKKFQSLGRSSWPRFFKLSCHRKKN